MKHGTPRPLSLAKDIFEQIRELSRWSRHLRSEAIEARLEAQHIRALGIHPPSAALRCWIPVLILTALV
jgi:hypothetical protein